MNKPEQEQWNEKLWRRPLTPEEELRLQQALHDQPLAQAQWEEESALTHLLTQVPATPVSSNFTARVLQAVEREEAAAARLAQRSGWQLWRPRLTHWLPRLALPLLIVAAVWGRERHQEARQKQELARSVVQVTRVATLPKLQWLEDFEAIERLSQAPPAEDALLKALLVQD